MSVPLAWPIHECKDARCKAPIFWAITAGRGRGIPVDVDPDPDGTVLLTQAAGSDTLVATVVNPNLPPLGGWPGPLHKSHFATCPAAADFRSRRR